MDASDLYHEDFVLWTEQQAAALRRLTGASNSLDIEHLAEEIESLGKRDIREVESYLRVMLVHILKVLLSPTSSYVPHWRSEIVAFQQSAAAAFVPSMRGLVSVEDQWVSAVRVNAEESPKQVQTRMIATAKVQGCPLSLDDLLRREFDLDAILDRCSPSLICYAAVPRRG